MRRRTLQARGLALLMAVLMMEPAWLAAVVGPPRLPDPGSPSGITKQEQEQAGLQIEAAVYKKMPVLPDSDPVSRYVQQLGRKLVGVIPPDVSWPYQFHVIPQKEINAFALPGGPIFINLGTIQAADSEAELAGVLAHEMSHIYMQHAAKQAAKEQRTAGILGVLGAILPGNILGDVARWGLQVGAGTIFMKYSRNDEAQADQVGAIIMYLANYSPKAMAEFFQKLETLVGNGGPQFLSDHPNPGNRVAAVSQEIRYWPAKNYLGSSPEFAAARQQATAMKTYTGQEISDGGKQGIWAQQNIRAGAVPPNLPQTGAPGASLSNVSYQQVQPSGSFTRFQHNAFEITYPSNWKVVGDQNSSVTIAPPAGVSQNAIAYGVVIGGARDRNASSLDQAVQDLAASLQQANPGMHVSGSPQTIQVNGTEGRAVNLSSNSPLQEDGRPLAERDWLVVVSRPQGGLLYLVFIAPESQFNQLNPTYQAMLNSLQLK